MPQTPARIGAVDPRAVQKIRDRYRIEIRQLMAGLLSDAGESTDWVRRRKAPPKQRSVGSAFGQGAMGQRIQVSRMDDIKAELDDRGAPPPSIGPVRALTVLGVRYSLVADRVDRSAMYEDETLTGSVINLSIAAFDRFDRPSEVTDDALPWVYAVLGDEWGPHAYDLGNLSGQGSGPAAPRFTTRYFDLHLDERHAVTDRPAGVFPE
jgi:hypothetical protein